MDLAVIKVPNTPTDQPSVALEYGEVLEGKDIGVVGYPLPVLHVVDGNLRFEGLVFRSGRGHVTARYAANLPDPPMTNAPIVEVDFLFVPGNSGGPVFSAETGRVLGYVKGYRSVKIRESAERVTMITQLPLGMAGDYIEHLNAIYSLALKLDFVRSTIETFGVTLIGLTGH
jgi:hypothetical protein